MPNYEQALLQRLFQSESGLTYAVYLAGMFAIIIWRREAAVNWQLFRISYLLFAASLVLPSIVWPFLPMFSQGGRMSGDSHAFSIIIGNALGPGLFAGAVICGFGSMLPRLMISRPAGPPPKHPLD